MDLAYLSARRLLELYERRAASPVEVLEACVARAEAWHPLRALSVPCFESARDAARAAEAAWLRGEPAGPLCGVPVAVKDLFDLAGVETTYGSPMFAGHVPERDAAAVAAVKAAGAVIVGKSVTHEFAWGMTCRHSTYGPTGNPWDPARTPGGSSGGSGAVLAAGMAALALGTDTGGSIRLPAALCGVVGHKPTHGAVTLDGVWPLVPELDHAGPMARTPRDAALLLEVLTGRLVDVDRPVRVGLPSGQPEVSGDTQETLAAVAELLGAREVRFPHWRRLVDAYVPIFNRGAVRTHTQQGLWPGRRAEYDASVADRMVIAEGSSEQDEARARRVRAHLEAEVDAVFDRVDVVLTAVTAAAPPPRQEDEDDLRAATTPLASPQNLLGLPACAVRAGFDRAGMPIGVQFTARRGDEASALAAADVLFRATPEIQGRRPARPAPPHG